MKKLVITLILFIVILNNSNAQCNVEKNNTSIGYSFIAEEEKIFRNEDLHKGLFSISISNGLYFKSSNLEIHYKHLLFVGIGLSGSKGPFAARELEITFEDNSIMYLKSTDIKKTSDDDLNVALYIFDINDNQTLKLMHSEIKNIKIIDNREQSSMNIKPYPKLLKEQINCIILKSQRL